MKKIYRADMHFECKHFPNITLKVEEVNEIVFENKEVFIWKNIARSRGSSERIKNMNGDKSKITQKNGKESDISF